jgi:hypothetical protein
MRIVSLASARAYWFQVLGLGFLAVGLVLRAMDYLTEEIISTGYITSKETLVKMLGWLTLLLVFFFSITPADKSSPYYRKSEWTLGARIGLFVIILLIVFFYLGYRVQAHLPPFDGK